MSDQAVTVKADLSQLYRKLGRFRAATPKATGNALKVMMTSVMTKVIDATGNDTNRMDRAFAEAANQAGLGPFPVPVLRESRFFDENRSFLVKQLKKWTKLEEFYQETGKNLLKGRPPNREDAGKVSPYFKLIQRRRRAAADNLRKFTGTSIFVDDRRKNRLRFTVRVTPNGGEGRFTIVGDTAVVEIKNKEPHALLVERKNRTVASTLKGAERKAGLRRGKRGMVDALKRAAAGAGLQA